MSTLYDQGYEDGQHADEPANAFSMNQYSDEYKKGYVIGYAFVESVRNASPSYAGTIAGELTRQYNLSYHEMIEEFEDDDAIRAFDIAYRNED